MNAAKTLNRPNAILFLLVFFSLEVSAQWIAQPVPPDVSILLSVDFSSTQHGVAGGYVLGFQGRAVYTTNGGTTWDFAQVPDSSRSLVSVQMLDNGLGYIAGAHNSSLEQHTKAPAQPAPDRDHSATSARTDYFRRIGMDGGSGYGGLFLKTTNDGQSWSTWGTLPESTYYLHDLSFVSPDTGFVTTSMTPQEGRAGILRTTNGGTTWSTLAIPDSIVSLPSIQFQNASLGFAVGYQHVNDVISGVVLRTTDRGINWDQRDFPQVDRFTGVSIANESTAYASGVTPTLNAAVYKTTYAGMDWAPLSLSPASTLLEGVCFAGGTQTGIVYGSAVLPQWGPYAARTTDGGSNWTPSALPGVPTGTILTGGFLLDENIGYLVGGNPFDHAVVFHTTNGGVTHISEDQGRAPQQFILYQNYPNPFNPATTIEFSLPNAAAVTLRIFDVLGREISTLVQAQLASGSYRARWDATATPSGVYYYCLKAGTQSLTRKLLLLK